MATGGPCGHVFSQRTLFLPIKTNMLQLRSIGFTLKRIEFINKRILFGHVGVTLFFIFCLDVLGDGMGHVFVTCWSRQGNFSCFFGHVGRCLGILWGCFRMGLGWFREKVPNMLKNKSFQICPGLFFQSRAAQN